MEEELWFLEAILDESKKWKVKIDEFPFILGRDETCHLTLSSTLISRQHAKIVSLNKALYIQDCKSTNGTLLNGRKINERSRLNPDDVISICDNEFKIICNRFEVEKAGTKVKDKNAPVDSFSSRYKISSRESEVLSYLVKGNSTKKIAEKLFISTGTAKNHILNILKKTDTPNIQYGRASDERNKAAHKSGNDIP